MLDALWPAVALLAVFAICGLIAGFVIRLFSRPITRPPDPHNHASLTQPSFYADADLPLSANLPYRKRPYLFTLAERSFYEVLRRSIPPDYTLFAKVRLIDILTVPANSDSRYSYQNKINSKHIDFLLCSASTISPALVIELDESSHQRPDRVDRDDFLDSALAAAGLPILHIRARDTYNPRDLSDQIAAALAPSPR